MKILVSGSSGLVGSHLVTDLTAQGHNVVRLVRKPENGGIYWNPDEGKLEASQLEGFDAVVHLAGESISNGRWTAEKKKRIHDSRTKGTQLLSQTLAKLSAPPKVFINASALGFYGDRGSEVLTEDSSEGKGFLAGVVHDWEKSCQPAIEKGIRTAKMRFGVILSPDGGALKKLLPIFQVGGGGILGSGKQYMSWIDIDDVSRSIIQALNETSLEGPINVAAPNPVTNATFTKVLGKVLGRPTIFPVPAAAARLIMGEMADELLLSSQRLEPAKLRASGFQFKYPNLEGSFKHLLGKAK